MFLRLCQAPLPANRELAAMQEDRASAAGHGEPPEPVRAAAAESLYYLILSLFFRLVIK